MVVGIQPAETTALGVLVIAVLLLLILVVLASILSNVRRTRRATEHIRFMVDEELQEHLAKSQGAGPVRGVMTPTVTPSAQAAASTATAAASRAHVSGAPSAVATPSTIPGAQTFTPQ